MELISIGKFAKMIGVTPATLRRIQETRELLPYHISKDGTHYYSIDQLKRISLLKEQVIKGCWVL